MGRIKLINYKFRSTARRKLLVCVFEVRLRNVEQTNYFIPFLLLASHLLFCGRSQVRWLAWVMSNLKYNQQLIPWLVRNKWHFSLNDMKFVHYITLYLCIIQAYSCQQLLQIFLHTVGPIIGDLVESCYLPVYPPFYSSCDLQTFAEIIRVSRWTPVCGVSSSKFLWSS